MVFSPELGYDPEEWEECGDSDHFLAFGFFTRIWLTFVTVGLAGAFFWLLEARKEWSKIDRDSETIKEKEPPPKPERRMSMEAMKAAEEMRREAAAASAARSGEPEIQSPQRDARSSISVERRLRQGAPLTKEEVEAMLEADKRASSGIPPISPEPPSSSFALPPGAFDNIDDFDKSAQKKQSLEQQYRILAKAIEQKLLSEIEQLGLLQGRHNEKDAPRQIAEQIQQKHQTEIYHAVNELVRREAGDIPYVADHFRKQLENQIEDAVWQYNQSLLHSNPPKDLYETELGPNDEPIWKPRQQQQLEQAEFDFTSSILDKRSPKDPLIVEETLKLYDQKPQGNLQVPPRTSHEPLEEQVGQRISGEPSSPKILITTNQQKGSSSSEDNGFIKVYPEQALPLQQPQQQVQKQNSNEYENVGAVGSPRPSSYDAGSSVTADDIEFVHSADNSPRVTDYPDVFGYENENIQKVGKIRPSDDLEDYENISSQNIWQQQQQQPQQQISQQQQFIGEEEKKPIKPEDIAHMRQLLNEYDLNSVRESEAEDLRQHQNKQQIQQKTEHQQQQQSLPPEIWQTQDILLEQPQQQQSQYGQQGQQQQQPSQFQQQQQQQQQSPYAQLGSPQQGQQPQFHQKQLQQNHQQDLEFEAPPFHSPKFQQQPQFHQLQQQQGQHTGLQMGQEPQFHQQNLQQQQQQGQPPQFGQQQQPQFHQFQQQGQSPQFGQQPPASPFQSLEQQPQSPKRQSKSKSPVHHFNEGENIAEFLFQMPTKSRQQNPQGNEKTTFILQNNSQKQGIDGQYENFPQQQGLQKASGAEPDDDPRRLAAADIYIQDAIDYIEAQRPATSHSNNGGGGGGFIIEEDMLESDKISPQPPKDFPLGPNLSELEKQLKSPSEAGKQQQISQQNISADPTSKMIQTNEIFTRPEPSFDDADDAITSAPEIQSIEIPPDQMSENSSNIMDNYDYRPGSSGAYSPPMLKFHREPSLPRDNSSNNQNLININNQNRDVHFEIDSDRFLMPSPSSPPLPPRPSSRTSITSSRHGSRSPVPEAPQLWRVSPIPYDETPSLSISERHVYMRKQSSLLSVLHVTSMQEMLLTLTSLEDLAAALRKAGLESTNIIFGIDYTASNKYQGENSFGGKSLHSVNDSSVENPYQQVIRIMGHSLASFATAGSIPVYGFGDASTGDWSVFKLKEGSECQNLEEVLRFVLK
jgi:hypothetical protein